MKMRSQDFIRLSLLAVAMFVFTAVSNAADFQGRDTLTLDGTWNFATDPENVGVTQEWFQRDKALPAMPLEGYAPEANGTIQVPGIWDDQGYGQATDKVRHNFIGCGWYKRTFEIPQDWAGKKIFLKLGGISRYAKGWINGESAGDEILGCIGENEWDITSLVVPGETSEVTLCVDSKQRWSIDALLGCSSIIDYMHIVWGGLWGHVTLEARSPSYVDSCIIRSDIKTGVCTAEASFINCGQECPADRLRLTVFDASNQQVAEQTIQLSRNDVQGNSFEKAISVTIPNVQLWTTDTPYLYRFELSLCQGEENIDTIGVRTGIRELKTEGSRLLLNGNDVVLRGYGDDHIYPVEFSMSVDKQVHLDRLAIIKSYGFNHVRHHSTILPQEYYDACDELGILSTAEYLIGYPHQLPGEGDMWKNNVPEGTDPQLAMDFYVESFAKVVKQYRNHPSIAWWVGGNELIMLGWDRWMNMPLRYDFQKIAKGLDPDRPFLDCDGDWKNQIEANDRDTQDIYIVLFDEWTSPIANGENKFKMAPLKKPSLSHESGNYCTFVRTDQYELFDAFTKSDGTVKRSNFIPFWMTAGMKRMTELGFDAESASWSEASEKLYLVNHKYNVEGMRLNPVIVGYHWWLVQDYWTTSNGLVDYFFRPKPGINPEEVRRINSDTLVLQKGLQRTARSGDEINITTLLSNFSTADIDGNQTVTLAFGEQKETKSATIPTCTKGTLTETGKLQFVVPELTEPVDATLSVVIDSAGNASWQNSWTCRLFPRDIRTSTKKLYAASKIRLPESWNAKPIPESTSLPTDAVYCVDDLDSDLVTALNQGAGIVLTSPDFLSKCAIKYQQVWWKAGDSPTSNHCGTFVYDHPIIDKLTDGNWCDPAWFDLVENAEKFYLEAAPCRPDVIIRALPSIVRVEDTALLFAVRVGKGTLVISGLNHLAASGRPENEQLLANMIDYAASSEKPKASWDPKFLVPVIKIPEQTVLGYKRMLTATEQISWKNFRSDNVSITVCRQTGKDAICSWQTDKVTTKDETTTFIFAGGFGYREQPATEGFTLDVNGSNVLRFDLPDNGESCEWTDDSGVRLNFELRRKEPQDSFGIFRLTVPRSLLKMNERQILTVRSLGEGSQRWFAVNPEYDLVSP
ncbi:MAG: glycoside hydrolase family 2 TIM barrel-domain containing protein [Planctomycetia bacterium]|nr:glycoside hydrolase family 2 TIM barrel-domain containing protein [Planctomycetia bacterium]